MKIGQNASEWNFTPSDINMKVLENIQGKETDFPLHAYT